MKHTLLSLMVAFAMVLMFFSRTIPKQNDDLSWSAQQLSNVLSFMLFCALTFLLLSLQ